MSLHWPEYLWVIRHGQSEGNVARDAADQAGLARIAISGRDVDVPLSQLGERQAQVLGHHFAQEAMRPDVLLSSPYLRALQTARCFRDAGGADPDENICMDERLREKEFGILDGLTSKGITSHLPEQAQFRLMLGKFYHRPPGGESWCDVILRLRSLMDTISLHYGGLRVMIFAHQVVVLCLRYIIENLDEAKILTIDREADVANCSITEYRFDPKAGKDGSLFLSRYNITDHLREETAPVTRAPDPIIAARG